MFEWDESKRIRNLWKHGLDFQDCPEVFDGHMVCVRDERFGCGEERFRGCGMLQGCVVVVAYAHRGELIRVISMRRAGKREQAFYFESIQD